MPSSQFASSIAANIAYWKRKTQLPFNQKLQTLDNDRQNLFRAVDFGLRLPETCHDAIELILESYELVLYMGYYEEWIPVLVVALKSCPREREEVRITLYNQLGDLYRSLRKFDTAMNYHIQEEALAHELNKPLFTARVNASIGKTLYLNRRHDEAENRALAALDYYKKKAQYIHNYASMLNLLGLICQSRGEIDAAENWFGKSVVNFRKTDLTIELARVVRNLAILLESSGKSEEALKVYHEAESLLEPTRFEVDKSDLYSSLGTLFFNREEFIKAETYYLKAYSPYMVDAGPLYTLATITNNLGNVYYAQNLLPEAERWLEKSLDTFLQANAHLMLANSMATLARALQDQGKVDRVENLVQEATEITAGYPEDAFAASIRQELSLVRVPVNE